MRRLQLVAGDSGCGPLASSVVGLVVVVVVVVAREPSVLVRDVDFARHEDAVHTQEPLLHHRPEGRDRRADAGEVDLEGREGDALGAVPCWVQHGIRAGFVVDDGLETPYADEVDAMEVVLAAIHDNVLVRNGVEEDKTYMTPKSRSSPMPMRCLHAVLFWK